MTSAPVPRAPSAAPVKHQPATLQTWIESDGFRSMVAKALPKHLTPDRFLRVALTAMMRTPKLTACTQDSVTQCLLQCSQLGIEPDGRRAHLIPFEDKRNNRTLCTLIIDYKGLVELAMRSGLVSYLHADVIREGDVFSYSLGEIREHVPWYLRRDADKPAEAGQDIAVYAYARMRDGASAVAVMSIDEVYAIRDNSQGYRAWKSGFVKSSTWDPTNWVSEQEMKKKTALRRLTKLLPLSPEFRDAVEAEDSSEDELVNVTPTTPKIAFKPAVVETPDEYLPGEDEAVEAKPKPRARNVTPTLRQEPPAEAPQDQAAQPAAETAAPQMTVNDELADIVTSVCTFDEFRVWASQHFDGTDTWGSFADVPAAVVARCQKNPTGMLNALRKAKGAQ